MPGYTGSKERTPSFVVSLNGVKMVGQMVEDGMKGIEVPQKTKTTAKRVERSDSQNEATVAAASLKNNQLKSLFGTIPKDKNKKTVEEVFEVNDGDTL